MAVGDEPGPPASFEVPFDINGGLVEYTHDAEGRLEDLVDPFGGTTSWTYATTSDTGYPVGAVMGVALSNGVDASLEHDSSGRVDRVLYEHSTTTLDDLVLTYNGLGLISRIDRLYDGASPVLGVRRDYEYDAAYRLAKESYTEIESGSPDTYTLKSYRACAYDAAGNRSTMTRWNTTDSKVTTKSGAIVTPLSDSLLVFPMSAVGPLPGSG